MAERANALLKESFAVPQPVSLGTARIGAITEAVFVLGCLEHDQLLPGGYERRLCLTRKGSVNHSAIGCPTRLGRIEPMMTVRTRVWALELLFLSA